MRAIRLITIILGTLASAPALASVPLSFAQSGHPTVPTVIEGAGTYEFVIDTGAEGTAIYMWFAERHRIKPIEGKGESLQGQTGSSQVSLARLPSVSVDGVTKRNIEAVIIPDRADGVPLPGIIGLDIIGDRVVEFDTPARRVVLHPSGAAAKLVAGTPMSRSKAARLAGGLLGLPVTVNGASGIAVLDTGARDSRLNWRFAKAAGITAADLKPDGEIQGATNNALSAQKGVFSSIVIGGIQRKKVSARIVDLPVFSAFGVSEQPAMILGMDLLQDVHMVVDFPAAEVWMAKKNAN